MTNITRTMSFAEKAGLYIALAGLILSFITLILSDNISNLFGGANIVANKQEIHLKPLINKDEYIGVINIRNNGTKPSMNAKAIIEFDSKVPTFKVSSDETFKRDTKDNKLILTLDRLSNNSSIMITIHSKFYNVKKINYIDDSGNQQISLGVNEKELNLLNLILLLIMLISLFVLIWIYRRVSENYLEKILEYHQNEMQEKLREIKDEISNIEIVINQPILNNIESQENSTGNLTHRIAEFMNIRT